MVLQRIELICVIFLICLFFCVHDDKQIGDSGKSVRELEKTIALLKKVVERVQMENQELKKVSHATGSDELQKMRLENAGLKV